MECNLEKIENGVSFVTLELLPPAVAMFAQEKYHPTVIVTVNVIEICVSVITTTADFTVILAVN
jgi:hypothetical protein